MRFKSSRRALLKAVSANGGLLTMRSFATGLPTSVLFSGLPSDEALAADTIEPQFLLMALNQSGEPINNNCPGVYDTGLPGIHHNQNASMTPTEMTIGGHSYRAAKPWADFKKSVPWAMNRMSFIHHDTRTNIHPQYSGVMKLMGSSRGPNGENNSPEYLPSIISSGLAPMLGAIQDPPLYLRGPTVDFDGQALGQLRPENLQRLFPTLTTKETAMRDIRDAELAVLNNALKAGASRKQKAWLDAHVRSLDELRLLDETLVERFSTITADTEQAAIDAALIAFHLNISPVATIKITFGGDNHNDNGLNREASSTVEGCATLAYLFNRLKAEGLEDRVTFASFGVFGRTLKDRKKGNGRDHNLHHHVTLLAGKHVNAGVYGGLKPTNGDFGATDIDSKTGASVSKGDIPLNESLESAAKTIGAACGLPDDILATRIQRGENGNDRNVGKIIRAAIKTA